MKSWWFYLVAGLLVVSLGCGGAAEKGKNSGKDDRPKAAKDE